MQERSLPPTPRWMGIMLRIAGIYNVLWGAWVVLFPAHFWNLVKMPLPEYLFLWQCIGMIVGVYGVGYWVAAKDPARHWPIVLVGFLGKVFGPIGFLDAWLRLGTLPAHFGIVNIFNDLVWLVPFALVLVHAAKVATFTREREMMEKTKLAKVGAMNVRDAMKQATVSFAAGQASMSLDALSERQPVLIVFLRHLGCTFCREALADLNAQRARIEASGTAMCIVSMADEASTRALAAKYGLPDIAIVSDNAKTLYNAFELERGTLSQLFGFRMVLRGVQAGVFAKHGVGMLAGDGFQLPGAFVVHKGKVVRAYQHKDAADRPDYCELTAAS